MLVCLHADHTDQPYTSSVCAVYQVFQSPRHHIANTPPRQEKHCLLASIVHGQTLNIVRAFIHCKFNHRQVCSHHARQRNGFDANAHWRRRQYSLESHVPHAMRFA
jgi:hypothetical protein